ncbi:MAG TPA: hypothetical protein VMC05_09210 [Xanthobacteraceae bacterium]|nr:hypothetical protein [Xanthobacteraceae bacterium]
MIKLLFVRIAGALAVTSLAIVFVGLIPFLGGAPGMGANYAPHDPGISVNRELKGDRLPTHTAAAAPTILLNDFATLARARAQAGSESAGPPNVPFACERSFSPVASPRLAYVYGRCLS